MLTDISLILCRDLDKLAEEIRAFKTEGNLWRTTGHITNPAGNLCLHLVGNLNTYIGANLGGSGYIRDREAEFSLRDIPKTELLEKVEQTKGTVSQTLQHLAEDQIQKPYPQQVLGHEMSTGFFLIHLTAHLSYHLGQINYLRRMLT